jgi:hypothetical protein
MSEQLFSSTWEITVTLWYFDKDKRFFYGCKISDGSEGKKSYYVSKILKATSASAIRVCQSFNMILASPQNQDEFIALKEMVRKSINSYDQLKIAGYRSEIDEKVWLDSDEKINYEMSWLSGEPNNYEGDEACIGRI